MREISNQRKPKLTTSQIEYCFLHLLRSPDLFDYAKQHLKPQNFSAASEMRYALLWGATLDAAARNNNNLPAKGAELAIAMELTSKIDAAGNQITPEAGQASIDMLTWCFGFDETQLNPDYYRQLIQELIIERTIVGEMTKDMTSFRDVGHPVDIIKSLDDYNKKLQSILVDPRKVSGTAFPKDFKPKKIGKFSTGLEWMDKYMNGGQAPGEVYALLGPSGVGKSSYGIMLATETARVWNKAYKEGLIPKPKVSCFFSWEQSLDSLRLRFWSFAARIDFTRLEQWSDEIIELSTRGQPEPYELKDFEEEIRIQGIDKWDCEKERKDAAVEELNDCVRVFDFSGAAENPRLGEGGLNEVASVLQALQKEGYEIGVVILDYAGLCVKRYMGARGEDPSNIRHHLSNFCNDSRFKIALPFNCPVWAFHQLNTESNRKSATADQHHSFASECGNFAENAWFAFVFSTKDKVNDMCRLYCTKERRAKGDRPPVILKIQGNYCRLADFSGTTFADEVTRQFVDKDMIKRRPNPADMAKRRKTLERERPGYNDLSNY